MPNKPGICFVSHNKNKLVEIRQLAPEGFDFFGLDELGLNEEIPETGNTIEENSALKAQFVFQRYKIACFADDTGLEIDALNGEPGVYSARYAGSGNNSVKNMELVLNKMEGKENRKARFKTVITYIDKQGKHHSFEGIVQGHILEAPKGTKGFGYDPIFKPVGYKKTFAEMTLEEKNRISHRSKSFNKFFSFLNSMDD
ncbi:MAG: RdgB/HAM1 family non-canonical purine NTP pyrophosphatase [Cyclobacteriaceae bacterium]